MLCNPQMYITLASCFLTVQCITASVTSEDFAVVIDAGSSGSRIRIYSWDSDTWLYGYKLPRIREKHQHTTQPGVSSLVDSDDQLRAHLRTLIDVAEKVVPVSQHASTDIFLFATAGTCQMRRCILHELVDTLPCSIIHTQVCGFCCKTKQTKYRLAFVKCSAIQTSTTSGCLR